MNTVKMKRIEANSIDNLMAQHFPAARWTVEGIIPEGGLTILSAAPGSFKTWLMLEITISTASGSSLFGKYKTNKTGVLFVDEESGPRMLKERFEQLGLVGGLPIFYTSRRNTRISVEYIENLLETCEEKEIGLVMFDSLVRLHSLDENTSKDMAELFNMFRMITDNGVSVLIAHHNRKPSQGNYSPTGEMRGSSDILAAVDCHMAMSRQSGSDSVSVRQTKNRYMQELAPFKLRFVTQGTSSFEYIGVENSKTYSRANEKKSITDALLVTGEFTTKKALYEHLQTAGRKIGMNRLGDHLDELIRDKTVSTTLGPRTAVYYHLEADKRSALET